jgi:hypothetical protein
MTDSYVVRTTRLQSVIGFAVGAGVMFCGLDIHYFHLLKASIGPNHPSWVFLVALGGLVLIGSIKSFVAPKTLLVADSKGITLFSGTTARDIDWNRKTKRVDIAVSRRGGDPVLIPWNAVVEIGEGVIDQGYRRHGLNRNRAKALKVLCDSSYRISGYDIGQICKTWNGYTADDLRLMGESDRAALTPDDVNSGFVIQASGILPGGLDGAIRIFRSMHAKFGQP